MLSRPAWPDHAVVAVALTYLGKDGFRKSSFRKLKTDCTNETVVYVTVFLLWYRFVVTHERDSMSSTSVKLNHLSKFVDMLWNRAYIVSCHFLFVLYDFWFCRSARFEALYRDMQAGQLLPEALEAAHKGRSNTSDVALQACLRDGYDHSYFFIASFMESHLHHHAKHLGITC